MILSRKPRPSSDESIVLRIQFSDFLVKFGYHLPQGLRGCTHLLDPYPRLPRRTKTHL